MLLNILEDEPIFQENKIKLKQTGNQKGIINKYRKLNLKNKYLEKRKIIQSNIKKKRTSKTTT